MFKAILLFLYLLLFGLPLLAGLPMADVSGIENNEADTISVRLLNQQCWLLRRTDPLSAIAIGKDALEKARKIGYVKGEAQVLNYLGVCYLRLHDSRTASEYFFKALEFSDSLNICVEKAYALNNIASSLNFEGEFRQALNYARKSLMLQIQNKDKKGIAYAYVRMSDIFNSLHQYDSLLFTAQTASKLFKELEMKENSLVALKYIGRAQEGKHQYNKALSCYLEISNSVSITKETVHNVYIDLARVYNLRKSPDQSIYYGKKWLSAEKDDGPVLREMAVAYALKEDWKEAFRYAQMDMMAMDSLAKEEKSRQIKNLQILYANKETEKENADLKVMLNIKNLYVLSFAIVIILIGLTLLILESKRNQQIRMNKLLNQKNEEISMQRDHLDELNQTKDKLFSIIDHDLRGPIGSTSTFLELLTTHENDFSKKELFDSLILIKDSSKATFKLLENLLTWARAQKGEILFKPLNNNLFNLVQSNINLFASNAESKKIRLANELDPDLSFEFDQEMINTVIRNLINNAIKYTREGGQITISAVETNEEVKISVKDTGIGMDREAAKILFITDFNHTRIEGTSGEKGTGLGLILCKEFVGKHKGNIWVESESGKGSTFKFTLPRSHPKNKLFK